VPRVIRAYVRWVDAISIVVGKIMMYGVFALIGLLIYSTVMRTVFNQPLIWTVEMGEFMFSAYYFLGGAYVILLRGHVRMDVFYSKWSSRRQGMTDVAMDFCLIFYLIVMIVGGINSTVYAVTVQQVKRSVWAPLMWPIKVIILAGIVLMLLQAFSTLFKDVAKARGKDLEDHLSNIHAGEV